MEVLKSSLMTTKCDASIQSQIEPMDLRQDKRRIWEMVHAAESQMLGELGREEHRSHNAIYKHGELCVTIVIPKILNVFKSKRFMQVSL